MTPQELKNSILQYAIEGKLVEQRPEEGNAEELYQQIQAKKQRLIAEKKIKKEKPLPEITDEIPFDIPDNWKWVAIGNLCNIYTGNSISQSVKKENYEGLKAGYDYIATKDISFNQIISYNNGVKIPFKNNFKKAYKDAILLCIEGGSAGRKIGLLDRDVCFGNKLCMFQPIVVSNKFLFYFLQSNEFKKVFKSSMTGIIGGVSINKLKKLFMPLPPLEEQKRIVTKIEELLPFVEQYEESYNCLEELNKKFSENMKKSILQDAIQGELVEQRPEEGNAENLYQQIQSEKQRLIAEKKIKKEKSLPEITEDEIPFNIPDNWKWVRLLDLVESKPSNGYSPKGVDYITPIRNLTLSATTSGRFKSDSFKYVDIEIEPNSKYWLKHNDLLIQRSNSRELVGTSCIYTGDDNAYIYPDLIMRLKVMADVSVDYIDYVLKSPMVRNYFSKNASGTSDSMPKINQGLVSNTIIPLPPLAEQKRIVAKIEELLPLCDELK